MIFDDLCYVILQSDVIESDDTMNKLIEKIISHSQNLPDEVQREVLDFIRFKENKLKTIRSQKLEVSILSEASLSEWNNEKEDEAWKSFQ